MNKLGREGEAFACSYYKSKGWQILRRNYRGRGFEVDFFAQKNDLLTVVEVKTRMHLNIDVSTMATLIPAKKKNSLKQGALRFLEETKDLQIRFVRFDLVICQSNIPHRPKLYVVEDFLNGMVD